METEGVHPDVDMNINGGGFLAPDDDILSPTNVVVAKESLELEKLQHRLSVRDLATQFESGLAAAQAAAAKITEEKEFSTPPKDTKRRSSGDHHCNRAHSQTPGHSPGDNHCNHSHGQTHGHSPSSAGRSPSDGPPALRSSLRRTSGNIRECERHKVKEVMTLDRAALIKRLRTLLGDLSMRVAGRNKDDVTESLSIVEVMELQWTQKGNELEQERADVRKMATLFKQASDDARRMVEEARAFAQAEVESAHSTVLRVEAALEEHAQTLKIAEKEEIEEMRKEITEARRIKMLHEPSKAMDMEFEIEGLRQQLTQKAIDLIHLRKELAVAKRAGNSGYYEVQGEERLGAALIVCQISDAAVDVSRCTIQWNRMSVDGRKGGPISGATRPQYAPEPLDVGWLLRADLGLPNGTKESVTTTGPLDEAPGLGNYVEALFKKGGAEFNVRLVQQNGEVLEKPLLHVLLIDKTRMKLFKGRTTKAREEYTSIIQVCGARGGGQAAARALYWVANKSLSLMLVLESERERNAAILLARRFARDQNMSGSIFSCGRRKLVQDAQRILDKLVTLTGPDDGISMLKTPASDS